MSDDEEQRDMIAERRHAEQQFNSAIESKCHHIKIRSLNVKNNKTVKWTIMKPMYGVNA